MKRRRLVEASANPVSFDYSVAELCEEDADEERQFKSTPFVLVHVLSLFADKLTKELKKIPPFHTYLSPTSSDRYLVFQVFRV